MSLIAGLDVVDRKASVVQAVVSKGVTADMDELHQVVVAVDIGGTKIASALVEVNESKPVILPDTQHSIPTQAAQGGEHVLNRVAQEVRTLCDRAHSWPNGELAVVGLAVASPGCVDFSGRIVSATDILPGWTGLALKSRLEQLSGLRVYALGDALAHTFGEVRWGAAQGYDSALLVAIGTGIGGGVSIDGKLLHGSHSAGGHVGHIGHPAAADIVCSCGHRGHIEPLASGPGLEHVYVQLGGAPAENPCDGAQIAARARQGDPLACQALEQVGQYLGSALGNLANVLDPAVIVLSGSVAQAGTLWLKAVRKGYAQQAIVPVASTQLVLGDLGDDAPLIGAAEAFLEGFGMCGRARGVWIDADDDRRIP